MTQAKLTSRVNLINHAVRKLQKAGLVIRSTRVGNIRPIIEIERPANLCQGFTVITRQGSDLSTLNVAPYGGCLVTWRV
ncbi:hypothetical protein [Photobacterium sanguinicancri]|uniref:Uncharacterized protein n=1 Tax=Photobacterium sanguinicancri TaxID=875932 RepID=A0AAW7Y3X6_9GAMM|nr:hypothetical protein [Photobacterium sanguinicancri]MDO6497355.1 hypothetical protein [Photobacterium sanguinicancri]MDO6542790.1 hypothetical protein [Photobacterium sanguinicancri]